jgi:hypothetical protein
MLKYLDAQDVLQIKDAIDMDGTNHVLGKIKAKKENNGFKK